MAAVGAGTTLRPFALAKPISNLSRTVSWGEVGGEFVSIQIIIAAMLERELAARGVQSLGHSDCMEIVENLLGRLKDLDREFAARAGNQTIGSWRDGPGSEGPGTG
jgi:hypothetical protein